LLSFKSLLPRPGLVQVDPLCDTDPMARLYRVILPVSDIEAATAFYRGLLGQAGRRVSAGRHYFDCGGTILACFDPRADDDDFDARPNPEHVYFAVADVDAVFRQASQLGCTRIDQAVTTQPWGERCFYAVDPFGNPFCVVDEKTVFTG
jgi:predicted enzyme related to lactoylglutathione lyase